MLKRGETQETLDTSNTTIRCLMLPLYGINLLVPNVCIAEVTKINGYDTVTNTPEWMLGTFTWRGTKLPLISFEGFLGSVGQKRGNTMRIAVFNSFTGNNSLPFYAMETVGIPRLLQVQERTITHMEQKYADLPPVQSRMVIGEDAVVIPDLEIVEGSLLKLARELFGGSSEITEPGL